MDNNNSELHSHLRFIKKKIGIILVLTLITTVSAFLFAYYRPTSYASSISFSVNRINKQTTDYYEYDGYYSIQASDLFSQTIISWFMTPSVLLEIYEKAGLDPHITSLEKFANRFNTKKYSAQNIVVTFGESNQERAQKLSEAVIEVVESDASKLNQTHDQKALFEIVGSKPVIVENKPNIILITIVGFVAGIILSLIIIYIIKYFAGEAKEEDRVESASL